MLRIGLLVADLSNEEICQFCQGAVYAAEKKEVSLTIIPGGMLMLQEDISKTNSYDYQQAAAYDYISRNNFDALLIDIEQIGKKISLLRKETFLNGFRGKDVPYLLLSPMEGYPSINAADAKKTRQQGYQAVLDILFYIEQEKLPEKSPNEPIPEPKITAEEGMHQLNLIAKELFHSQMDGKNIYYEIMRTGALGGLQEAAILMYGEGQINTPKEPWIMPERILVKGALAEGKAIEVPEGTIAETMNVLGNSPEIEVKSGGWIGRVLYLEEEQQGIFVAKISSDFLLPHFESLIFELLQTTINTARSKVITQELTEEILSLQEELERDDSVLDHIGEKDYMTGEYNRRGFFTRAYDYMTNDFKKDSYAVVAYIDIDSIKSINELFGREEGNFAVKKVASILHEVFGEEALLGRIRGDEFAILLITEDSYKEQDLRNIMMKQNGRLMEESGKPYLIHLIFSVCSFSYSDHFSLRDMLKETDDNLKQMKRLELDGINK